MKKVLFVQANIQPPGGGNAVSVWILEALKAENEVTLLTFDPVDFEAINRFYGTALKPSDLKVTIVNPLIRRLIHLDPDPRSSQPACYLMRMSKFHRKRFDVVISADDEMDFGGRGIQYLHYPYLTLDKAGASLRDVTRNGIWRALLRGNYRPWMMMSGFSLERMKRNLTLTNSQWTAKVIGEAYGIAANVVYPPVPGSFPDIDWTQKTNTFVCLGRFIPEKKIEQIINILVKVRETHSDIRLNIIGSTSSHDMNEKDEYHRQILAHAEQHSSWITVHENLPREELVRLLSTHRYGIHAHEAEHFGIGVAEMVSAGCLTFVPNDGGQVEIVDDKRLVYADVAEAVTKINQVLGDPQLQFDLHRHLKAQATKFTTETFCENMRETARNFG